MFRSFKCGLALAVVAGVLVTPAVAQTATPMAQDRPVEVGFTKQERVSMLQMCETARWAARIQFDAVCEVLKARFTEAEARATASPPPEAKAEPKPVEPATMAPN